MPLDQVTGEQGAETTGAARDQDGALGVERLRDLEHDLADVLALAQVAEGLAGPAHVPAAERRVPQHPALEQLDDLDEHLLDPLWGCLAQVEGAVGDTGVRGRDLLGVADVGLAHLDEAAAAGQQLQRGVDELARQRVEDDVDAFAAGRSQELLLELEVARGGDVVVVEAELAQRLPLARAGGGEDLGAEVLGELDRRHADAAGAGVDQDLLARHRGPARSTRP